MFPEVPIKRAPNLSPVWMTDDSTKTWIFIHKIWTAGCDNLKNSVWWDSHGMSHCTFVKVIWKSFCWWWLCGKKTFFIPFVESKKMFDPKIFKPLKSHCKWFLSFYFWQTELSVFFQILFDCNIDIFLQINKDHQIL